VKLALNGSRPVEFLNRMGGNVPSHEEVLRFVQELARREGLEPAMERKTLEEERMANV
jgi:hypothetical protein